MKSNLAKTGHAALLVTFLAIQALFSQTIYWNVVEAGAKGDGQADDTLLFQRLLDEAGKAGGGVVDVPAGRFRINGHLTVPANVTSAILTANQAAGGFRVENQAGRRAQIALNEEDSIEWTAEARAHYRIEVGAPGDGRYLQGWHGPERTGRPFRWTMPASRLVLPVVAGQRYTIRLEVQVPTHALGAEAGLYADGQLLAPLSSGPVLTANMPAVNGERVRLELRCAGWIPQKVMPNSQDPRTLGVQVFTVTMRAEGAPAGVFNANTGAISAKEKAAPDKP